MERAGLRIAIIGSRGIPQCWSGFETFAEELSIRLVELGNDVTVYCRKAYSGEQPGHEFKGVKLVYTPYLTVRSGERISHDLTSLTHAMTQRFDIIYVLASTTGWMWWLLKPLRRPVVVLNTDGLEWKRRKWGPFGRAYLKFSEWNGAHAADALVSDAKAMQTYFQRTYGKHSEYLTNGSYVLNDLPEGALDQWGVEKDGYYLVACRIEPENNIDLIVKEFVASGSPRELVIAGGMNYETPFWTHLQELAKGHRVRFLGPVYGPMLVEKLHLGCYGYLHGHEVGGTNPSLLKAMGCGNCAIVLDSEFNLENVADTGVSWSKRPGDLADKIRWADANPDEVAALGKKAQARIAEHYSWDTIAAEHDRYFREVARAHGIRA